MERDLTAGSVFKTVIYFSLPYLLSYFLQTLYGMADLFIVGQFGGVSSTMAVSMGSIVICVGVFVWMNKHTEKYMERNVSDWRENI
mgnify:CR=1 FL=1